MNQYLVYSTAFMFRPLQSYPYISYTIFIEVLLLYFVRYIHGYMKSWPISGVSMNILRAGNKSPVQRGLFRNSAGDLLPTLDFLGGLYNFCNLVIKFSLM